EPRGDHGRDGQQNPDDEGVAREAAETGGRSGEQGVSPVPEASALDEKQHGQGDHEGHREVEQVRERETEGLGIETDEHRRQQPSPGTEELAAEQERDGDCPAKEESSEARRGEGVAVRAGEVERNRRDRRQERVPRTPLEEVAARRLVEQVDAIEEVLDRVEERRRPVEEVYREDRAVEQDAERADGQEVRVAETTRPGEFSVSMLHREPITRTERTRAFISWTAAAATSPERPGQRPLAVRRVQGVPGRARLEPRSGGR